MSTASTRTLRVDALARVEGEGGLAVRVQRGGEVDVQLHIYEPPRFFEAFLRGRDFREAPDITARICGICPVAYQISAINALEDVLGVTVDAPLQALRRLLYCGEWIESHVLHICLLHAPDFLGFDDVFQMATQHPEIVEQGLKLKQAGNAIVTLLGGREIHPLNLRAGGFYRIPTRREWAPIEEQLLRGREIALELVRWTAQLPFPDFEQDYEFVALRPAVGYPLENGRAVSNHGLNIGPHEFEAHFAELHVPYSTALHSVRRTGYGVPPEGDDPSGATYMVGPLARYALNYDRLSPLAQEAAQAAHLGPICRNPFQSIVVRSIETLFACDEALRILATLEEPAQAAVGVEPRVGIGYGWSEAPRGLLYHRYELDAAGIITAARIVPPTAQNQRAIERDLRKFIPSRLQLPKAQLTWQCEQAIRNYDPCISCSAHFLTLDVQQE